MGGCDLSEDDQALWILIAVAGKRSEKDDAAAARSDRRVEDCESVTVKVQVASPVWPWRVALSQHGTRGAGRGTYLTKTSRRGRSLFLSARIDFVPTPLAIRFHRTTDEDRRRAGRWSYCGREVVCSLGGDEGGEQGCERGRIDVSGEDGGEEK